MSVRFSRELSRRRHSTHGWPAQCFYRPLIQPNLPKRMISHAEPTEQGFAAGEIAPAPHQSWVEEDEFSILKKRFHQWMENTEKNEELFLRHVYKNEDVVEGDFRQHRLVLCNSMANGESIAYDFLTFLGKSRETGPETLAEALSYIKRTDQKVDSLRATFFRWHGPVEAQTDIPPEFIKGMRDIESGKTVDMEEALSKPAPGVQIHGQRGVLEGLLRVAP